MKPTNQLTELSIKQAKPKEKQYKLTDGDGMYLRVYPNGSKYWQLQYWFEGKQKILSLGVWPDVSFVAVGTSGTLLTSSDGTTWTSRTSGTTETLHGIAYKE